jgi:hypothetical protein
MNMTSILASDEPRVLHASSGLATAFRPKEALLYDSDPGMCLTLPRDRRP